MAGVVAVGTRRCGGGMAGEPFYSNTAEGAALACAQECDILVCEGSGAAIPPVGVDSVLLVASAAQPGEYILGYLGPYRLLLSDVVLVTMCDGFQVSSDKLRSLIDGVLSINPGAQVVRCVFRPRPLGDLEGKKVFLASTAPGQAVEIQARHLAEVYGASVTGTTSSLSDRSGLKRDLRSPAAEKADVFVTELKAAGVDTVSAHAKREGKQLVYIDNVPVSLDGDLEEELRYLESLARKRCRER